MLNTLVVAHRKNSPKLRLFRSPLFSMLSKGDEILIDAGDGHNATAFVDRQCTIDDQSEEFEIILELMNETVPLPKVMAVVTRTVTEMDWSREEKENEE